MRPDRLRHVLLWVAGARAVLGLLILPFAPFLYREHFLLLVLLRPTKEVLLAGGFLVRDGRVPLLGLVLAGLPILLAGVWLLYYLGRAYAKELEKDDLPGIGSRILPSKRIKPLTKVLRKKGARLVFLGRLAAFPSSLVAAAAGSSRMPSRKFLVADTAGGVLSMVEVIGLGYALGEAYEEAGPWLTATGVVVLVVAAVLFGRYLKRT